MEDTVSALTEKILSSAELDSNQRMYGDLFIILEDGSRHYSNELSFKKKKLFEAGINRFSNLRFKFEMLTIIFSDGSQGYTSLKGLDSLEQPEFKIVLKTRFPDKLQEHFSIKVDGEFVSAEMEVP